MCATFHYKIMIKTLLFPHYFFQARKITRNKSVPGHGYSEKSMTYKRMGWTCSLDMMKMVNHQTGKSTDLTYGSYTFKTGLTDKDFNKNTLKRAR